MLGLYRTGQVPFRTVYLHGLVLDGKGQKMSKSKGNVINPLELIEKFGADALRMGLIVGNTPGTSLALFENKIKAYKHFANKIWNASRFVLENVSSDAQAEKPKLTKDDESLIKDFNETIKDVTVDTENLRFYLSAEKLYHYFWHTFADKIIEESKPIFTSDNAELKSSREWTIFYIFKNSLIMLHPFMPFLTEEIWSLLPNKSTNPLIIEKWPEAE